ncbi:MAG: acyl-ACP--UDP-N-acetylglucosamine O-acyltransferase [Alphaproteobacteria bacterium]|nr:acyl-ACP--UDP-N-acetylglucosamine O-acyltransferase [Alphaproteobacteria bacterium]
MAVNIHPTAIVDKKAQLGEDVEIGPYCVVGDQVVLGDRVKLVSHVWVGGDTSIGEDTEIRPFAAIGGKNQDLKDKDKKGKLVVGKRNSIREYATMQPGTPDDHNITTVGDDGLFMIGTHIAHDCIVGNHIIMSNNATLAGHVKVGDWAIIGGLSAVHQFSRIGHHAMVGGMCGVARDVVPYSLVSQAGVEGVNIIGLKRKNFPLSTINSLRKAFDIILSNEGNLSERLATLENDFKDVEPVMDILGFMRADNKRGFMHAAVKQK